MRTFSIATVYTAMLAGVGFGQQEIQIQWQNVLRENRSNASLQAVVTPLMGRGSAMHDKVWGALKDLKADYVRYVPWLPYPRLAVAELEPPEGGKTSWDFSRIDPFTIDFLRATKDHPVMLNFSTIPQWMFKMPRPAPYPADPNRVVWDYEQGTELRDPSLKELGDYYARLVSWYARGGFVDEFGKRHDSGHRFRWDYWEVLNEPDMEQMMDWETGRPNSRYWGLKLLRENFGPGDKLVKTSDGPPGVYAQAFLAKDGKRKLLVVNTRNEAAAFRIARAAGGKKETVDQTTGFNPPTSEQLSADRIEIKGWAMQVITLP